MFHCFFYFIVSPPENLFAKIGAKQNLLVVSVNLGDEQGCVVNPRLEPPVASTLKTIIHLWLQVDDTVLLQCPLGQ